MSTISDDQSLCYTATRLRSEFKLRPKKDAPITRSYKNEYGTICKLYKLSDCEPIRIRAATSEKQMKAQEALSIHSKLKSKRMIASQKAHALLQLEPLFLDTETTGLDRKAQIIEIAVTDALGNVLFESRLKPSVPIHRGAFGVHGITLADLTDAPTWPEIAEDLKELLSNRLCVIYNKEFDDRLIFQTASAFDDPIEWWSENDKKCAMKLAAECFGSTNRYGSISLENAIAQAGVIYMGAAHSAAVDAKATADLVRSIAQLHLELEKQVTQ
ncbi:MULTISPECIES: 3'-5' exonuclease [Acinetobacter]|uniref:3'-5' exonuclease n=2 Tax=Acinetobacter TaxID=469 RepID=A0AA46PCF1_9GAMM|nr:MULTISPECIES: 3'-5' exonuclease [Acinetobacter]UYF77358.1 3'-5' exonuclease [Acinetobacter ursingii]